MSNNLEIRSKIISLGEEIVGDVHHGECFYDEDMLDEFCRNLDKMKRLAVAYFYSNQEEE